MLLKRPTLSVVVIFHNMRREADRTLHSLTKEYQLNIDELSYEVIAIDSNSNQALEPSSVTKHGEHFRYINFATTSLSPVDAINHGAKVARGKYLIVLIDGARILSPGVLSNALQAAKTADNPFIYTLGFHLGPDIQNRSMLEGYNQVEEDKLLASIDWLNGKPLVFYTTDSFS